jgi:hypothetical protein
LGDNRGLARGDNRQLAGPRGLAEKRPFEATDERHVACSARGMRLEPTKIAALTAFAVWLAGCSSAERSSNVAAGAGGDASAPDAGGVGGQLATGGSSGVAGAPGGGGGNPQCTPPYPTPAYVPAADDAVAFQSLLEAAGYAAASGSDWVSLAAGNVCGGSEAELVLVKNQHSNFSVLRGPAPHAVGSGDLDSDPAHPWRAATTADLDGDGHSEVVAVRQVSASGVDDFVVAHADSACALTKQSGLAVGSPGNSAWAGITAGDFDGDGTPEIAAVKQSHSAFVFLKLASGKLQLWNASDLDHAAGHAWKGLASGDLDGDGKDELVAVRSSPDAAATIFVYRYDSSQGAFVKLASSAVGANGNSDWAGVTVGDFNGDGERSIVIAKNAHSNFVQLAYDGGAQLTIGASADLASTAGQPWKGLVAVDWLGADQGAQELVAARSPSGNYQTDLFVYGSEFHRAMRDGAVQGTRAQYAMEPLIAGGTEVDSEQLKEWLTETHTRTYSFLLWDTTGDDYLNLVRFLEATRDFCVDGDALKVWVTLVPPTEISGGKCSRPAESPLTPFSEASFFGAGLGSAACTDYVGWGELLGALATQYPQLVALNVDDFTHNVSTAFTPEVVAKMVSAMRSQAPWMSFIPTSYYRSEGNFVFSTWPDLGATVDSLLFYFRNEKQGAGPCSACPPPGSCGFACLSGSCAEQTVQNLPGEANEVASGLFGRKIQLGIYATGHSSCGTPSVSYVRDMLETAMSLPAAGGVTVYTLKHPTQDCATAVDQDLGCVVQTAFAP